MAACRGDASLDRSGSLSWAEMTAAEVVSSAREDAILIVPVGSTEQHGPHLPSGVDTVLASAVASSVAARLRQASVPAIVAPSLPLGLAEHHMALGGTITLDDSTFRAVLGCVVRSAARQGFRRIVLLNGHGGNIHALASSAAAMSEELDLPVVAATYWLAAADAFAGILETQDNVLHACEAETAMMMAVAPELVRGDRIVDAVPPQGPVDPVERPGIVHRRPFGWYTPTGVLGDPRRASPEKGRALIDAASSVLAESLADEALWQR